MMDEFDSIIFDLPPKYDDDKGSIQYLNSEDKFKSESFDVENIPERGGKLLERARSAFSLSFSFSDMAVIQDPFSQYKTPPVISSKSFLDSSSPFLSNTMVQPSPNTGKFPFLWNKSCALDFGADDSASFFEDLGSSTFDSKPIEDSGSSFFPEDSGIVPIEFSVASSDNTVIETFNDDTILGGVSNSLPPLDDDDRQQFQHQQRDEEEQRSGGDVMMNASGDDGYNWRKYGQKHVKCSDFPRSYYKCTHPNCPVKKKVERSYEGHITEIIYEKSHNHPEPVPNRRSNHPTEVQIDPRDQNRGGDAAQINGLGNNFSNIEEDHNQQEGGARVLGYQGEEYEHESKRRKIEASYAPDQMSGATRAMKEPRVVVQTTSEIDILEDGFRWRKYGQKVVKGNPNPRSYYKCTSASCPVRKHVERASHDLRSVITTYEGKHNHPVPAARNSSSNSNNNTSHVNSTNPSVGHAAGISAHPPQHHLLHRVDPYQVQNELSRFHRPYGMTGRQLMGGHPNGFTSFGMNHGLGTNLGGMMGMGMGGMNMNVGGMGMNMNMGMGMDMGVGMNMGMGMGIGSMGGLGSSNQGNMAVSLPAMPNYLGQQNQMGLMVPKGEPISESSINNIIINNNNNHHNNMANGSSPSSTSSASSVYHQMLNMPVGPQI